MHDTVSSTFDTSSEAVVFTVVVVVTHFASRFSFDFDFCYSVLLNNNVVLYSWATLVTDFSYCFFLDNNVVFDRSTTFVLDVVVWLSSTAVLSFGDVDLVLECRMITDDICAAMVVVVPLLSSCSDVEVGFAGRLVIGGSSLISTDALVLAQCRKRYQCSPFTGKVYFSKSLCCLSLFRSVLSLLILCWIPFGNTCFLLVDDTEVVFGTFFTGLIAAVRRSFDVDSLFFFSESSIFPSDALGGTLLVDFPFYLSLCGRFAGSSVTPVR